MVRVIALFLICMLFSLHGWADEPPADTITLTIPETVLSSVIATSMPIQLVADSDTIDGSVVIKNIENFKLGEQHASGLVTLVGEDIHIKTAVAGQSLRLKVGTMTLQFNIDAETRFDENTQTLYIKPTVTQLSTDSSQTADELGNLLIGLFNGKEFPLNVDKLQPIITDTGSKKLMIQMHIKRLWIDENRVHLQLLPKFNAVKRQKKKSSG